MSEGYIIATFLGLFVSILWILVWVFSEQYGFLFLGFGYILIYSRAIKKQLTGGY